ncbi:DNA polymerase III subunit chi [Sphingomonas sp. ID0503]|uniref:DNA polymerase III subunit chi n=1 Tax=Sphingomonas sp. ID0503 TaxID=3399691 RepID=UPI003AFB56FA
MQVDFYHLSGPAFPVVARIGERILADGGRLLVIVGDGEVDACDEALWTHTPDSFLPHGRADRPDAAAQPVLIATDVDPGSGASAVAIADGVWRDSALAFTRAFHLFDESNIVAARAAWKDLAGREGVERRYWRQEGGKWKQVA